MIEKKSPKNTPNQQRAEKVKQSLRANLQRRKQKARALKVENTVDAEKEKNS